MKKLLSLLTLLTLLIASLLLASCSFVDLDPCKPCVDENGDFICDKCNKTIVLGRCEVCTNANGDEKCDVCGAEMPSPVINDIVLIENGIANFQFVLAKGIGADTRKMIDYTVIRGAERMSGVVMTSVTEGFSNDVEQEIEVLVGDVKNRGEEYSMNRFDHARPRPQRL